MKQKWLILASGLIVSLQALANGGSIGGSSMQPMTQHLATHTIIHHQTVTTDHFSMGYISATLTQGSLRDNITRIAKQYGWSQVVWKADYDFDWVGNTQIDAASLSALLDKVLADYPLQAVFYEGNHILVIQPRNLK